MLSNFSRNAWHVRGFPHKDVSVGVEEVGEHAFLFGGKHGADVHHFALGVARVYEDLLGALHRLERPGRPLGVGCFFDDLPQDAWHIRGFPHKDVFVVAEEVDERAFLFGGERGTDAYRFTLRVAGVYEDLLRALCQFERPSRFLGVGCFFGHLILEGDELLGGNSCRGVATAFDLAFVGMWEGGADGDDPMGARHF